MGYNLKGLRVLVTRPRPKGEELSKEINAAHGISFYFPAIEILPPDDINIFLEQVQSLDQFDWIIFISPQAVIQSEKLIHETWPILPKAKIAAIGGGTAETLRKYHLPVQAYPQSDWNSKGLLELPEFKRVSGQKIAIISGEGGRELLEKTLIDRGAQVTKIIVYKRYLPSNPEFFLELLKFQSIDIIVSTSVESLENLKGAIMPAEAGIHKKLLSIPILVISERVAEYAKKIGFMKVIIAQNPKHQTILEILDKQKGTLMQTNTEEQPKKTCPIKKWGILFFLLLLLLISGLGFLGYTVYFKEQNSQETISNLQNQVNENNKQLTELKQTISDISGQLSDKTKSQADLIASIQQTLNGGKESWRIVQDGYLVKLANDNLQFEQNAEAALQLLQNVDNDLVNIENNNLLNIRRALASDIESLKSIPKVDVNGIFTRLAALNDQVDTLPLFFKQSENGPAKTNSEQAASWWKRGLLNTWQDLRSVVMIRYNKSGKPPLISPDQREFLLQNLHAKIENSIWALLHKNSQVYQASLNEVIKWTKLYFVQDAQATQTMLSSLDELKKINIQPSLPSINASVQAFHDYFANNATEGRPA